MTLLQALVIAFVQGATELFPISSLGHAVVLPALAGWTLDQRSPEFLPFLVLLHTGTALALLIYFWRDWLALVTGVLGLAAPDEVSRTRRLFVLIVAATIPAVIVGYAFNHVFRALFATPLVACAFLVVNGLLLLGVERLRSETAQRDLSEMTVTDALIVGAWQCGALFPGVSRSGATIAAGLLRGFGHVDAARFSFLIALPIIVGATVLEVPHLLQAGVPPLVFRRALVAALVASATAFLATAILMRWFKRHDSWALDPFGIYCLLFGGGAAAFLLLR